jgi:hypothetical protein
LFRWFPAWLPISAAARPRVKLERPQPVSARQSRARTNELDPGKRRLMIASEEEPAGYG